METGRIRSYATDLVVPGPSFTGHSATSTIVKAETTRLVPPHRQRLILPEPKISPDGRFFAYANRPFALRHLVVDYEGEQSQELPSAQSVAFSRDDVTSSLWGRQSGRSSTSLIGANSHRY